MMAKVGNKRIGLCLRFDNHFYNVSCPLCGQRNDPGSLGIFIEGAAEEPPICRSCAIKYAPGYQQVCELVSQRLYMTSAGYRVGKKRPKSVGCPF